MKKAAPKTTFVRTTASGDKPVIACQQLTKVFKDFWMRVNARAVDQLDLVIERQEVFGLLGPNGSGKSTTIKMILGLLRPTSGRVAVFGRPPSDVVIKRRIGYLPEESYLYPFLNARETLDYYGKLFEIDRATRTRRIDELLEMVGLTHAQFRPVRDYSKGMQRRIGLAQALINDPDLLILDEPTTGLDPIGTRQVKDLILELGRRGKTVLLSSHLLGDVEDVVDRMVILYGGRARGEGTCEDLLEMRARTSIETDELDDDTIAEIDRLIRQRTGGEKSIRSVTHPRQKLEELFLGIVEKARNERLETSGSMAAGQTAAFLRGSGRAEGEELINKLLEDRPDAGRAAAGIVPGVAGAIAGTPAPQTGGGDGAGSTDSDASLISELMGERPEQPQQSPPPPAQQPDRPARAPEPEGDIDRGIIGDLLGDDDSAPKEGGR